MRRFIRVKVRVRREIIKGYDAVQFKLTGTTYNQSIVMSGLTGVERCAHIYWLFMKFCILIFSLFFALISGFDVPSPGFFSSRRVHSHAGYSESSSERTGGCAFSQVSPVKTVCGGHEDAIGVYAL